MIQTLFGSVPQEPSLLDRLKAGIEKTRTGLVDALEDALSGRKEIDSDLLDELEYTLITADNGVGKTTTIGKLTQRFKDEGRSVLMCAADTFRAAAIEQLEVWGERTGTDVIRQKAGADPSAVLFDALQAAKARKVDYVIVDTAGRLHTKDNLMAELEKMKRTTQKVIPSAPHEVLLVLAGTTGQNGLEQERTFT